MSSSPIDVVCTGSPRAMGRAQGFALRSKILAARRDLSKIESFALRRPPWMPYTAYRWLAERKAWREFAQPLSRDYPAMIERLQGIADGAGLGLRPVALFNVLEPLLSAASGCTACPAACSAVAVRGRCSATGETIVARNFDYLPLVQPYYVLRESQPASGLRSLDFTVAPLAGAVDGMNEHGLCITYDYAFATDEPRGPAAPISMLIAEALERCATVAEAAEHLAARPRWGGGLLLLADAHGDIASLELSSTRSRLRRPAPGEDRIFHTNAYSDDAMREVQVALDAVYDHRAPGPLRGRRLHESSERRDARFRQLLDATDVFDENSLAAVMADHGPNGTPSDHTPCVHGTYWYTTACLMFFPQSRRLRIAYGTACQAQFEEVTLTTTKPSSPSLVH
jgi:hypothetical protein